MDELAARLKRDAAEIQADTSPELQVRLNASLHAVHTIGPIDDQYATRWNVTREPGAQDKSWLLSGLTGLAAVALVILLVNWNPQGDTDRSDGLARNSVNNRGASDSGSSLPDDWNVPGNFSLNVRPADLTRSLDEELLNLQSDLEKARESVERDVKFTF